MEGAVLKGWEGDGSKIQKAVSKLADEMMASYRANPALIEEHVGLELEAASGGYGRRQVFELIQNAADQLVGQDGKIEMVLTKDALYCANSGKPFTKKGLTSILHAYLSAKDDEQIGRFGLGFKSVLGVTRSPTVLSRSGSFRFGDDVSRAISEISPDLDHYPLLRVAESIDSQAYFARDKVAKSFSDWAATIIILPLASADDAPWIAADIRSFPQAFLAFAEHVGELHLEDRETGNKRAYSATRKGAKVTVKGGPEPETWNVFESEVLLGEKERARAGKLADREAVTVKWAVSGAGGDTLGSFWSYFPTDDKTTLRGVLNAPWQLSEDRRRLVDGAYNESLLEGAASLVSEAIEGLNISLGDPTEYLDLLPGRGREPRSWADSILTKETNRLLATGPSIPMLAGGLELPAAVRLHPPGIPPRALEIWSEQAETEGWVSHRIDPHRDRRARISRYIENAPTSTSVTLDSWFQAMSATAEPTAELSIAMILVADLLRSSDLPVDLENHPFVMARDGTLVPLGKSLTLPGKYSAPEGSLVLVHPDVAKHKEAASALERLGVERTSVEVELRRILNESPPESDAAWEHFWTIARQLQPETASSLIKAIPDFDTKVRTRDGKFRRVVVTLLPGRCVDADGDDDKRVAIDAEWHRQEINLLRLLGCVSRPERSGKPKSEPWFVEYVNELIEAFMKRNAPARIGRDSVEIVPGSPVPGPLTSLRALSDEGKAKLTHAALEVLDTPHPWIAKHSTQKYQQVKLPNPAIWFIQNEGLLETPLGPRPPEHCVGPQLRAGNLCPAPSCSTEVAEALGLPAVWDQVDPELTSQILDASLSAEIDSAVDLYSQLVHAQDIQQPERLRCLRNGKPETAAPVEIAASSDPKLSELIAEGHNCVISVSAEVKDLLTSRWGLMDASDLVSRRIAPTAVGERIPITDAYPPLKKRLNLDDREVQLQACEQIRVIEEALGGTRSHEVSAIRDGDVLLHSSESDDREILRLISDELGLELSSSDVDRVIKGVASHLKNERTKAVRGAATDAERLLLLLGVERIKMRLPGAVRSAYSSIYGEPSDARLAELALSVHGVDVLKVHKADLEEIEPGTPNHWGGSRKARDFVQALNFPVELAGFETEHRPPALTIQPRPSIPQMHPYQSQIVSEMQVLFSKSRDNRAMLTLPTGAGKTRVAVEGLMGALADELLSENLILWVAQSDELCEQAVQAWSELWRAADVDEPLTISRLWAGNEVEPVSVGVHVVVATIDKLTAIQAREKTDSSYEWIRDSGAVIVDEAHRSISKSYTELFRWLGLDRNKFGAPLIGLSATPYRGRSEEETERLVNRYGKKRLDHVLGTDDHYPMLQEMGVISNVVHEVLPGSDVKLSRDQLQRLNQSGLLPTDAGISLGEDVDRTKRVIESIAGQDDDWPILVFAPSVENAQALAGLLEHRGIPSASISGETPPQARQWYVREFREGNLRVLTNYGVFAEGFDAPSVRAVYIARPVFAPNRYQQMIGRGLRGPLNGGEENCLIVDVADNIVSFEQQLAFHEFDHLWDKSEAGANGE